MARAIFISGPPGAGKTTISAELGRLLGNPIVEVDAVKIEWYGSTARCDDIDGVFSGAGQRAREALEAVDQVIVVEAFADDEHVELVRKQLPEGILESHFFLWCDPAVAVQRKRGELDEATVMLQFARFTRHYPTRIRIDTSKATAADIAGKIAFQLQESAAETAT